MDRRKTLATAGAISLTASAALVALGSSLGLFGLADSSPNVGKLSPIDATHQVASTTTSSTPVGTPAPGATVAGRDGADDHGRDGAADDDGDHRGSGSSDSGADNSGPGSSSSGSAHDDDD